MKNYQLIPTTIFILSHITLLASIEPVLRQKKPKELNGLLRKSISGNEAPRPDYVRLLLEEN